MSKPKTPETKPSKNIIHTYFFTIRHIHSNGKTSFTQPGLKVPAYVFHIFYS